MPFIFLSYSHKDSEYANRLADTLEAKGLHVWIDERIDYGATWPQAIEENLDRCAAFVVVMTPDAKQSKWVQNELAYAMGIDKPIFPVRLAGPLWVTVAATQVVSVTGGDLPPASFYSRLAGILAAGQAETAPTTSVRERLRTELDELQRRYDNLSNRIRAVDTDLGREPDSERRLMLEERRADLAASREKTAARMEEIEALLAQVAESTSTIVAGQPASNEAVTVLIVDDDEQFRRQLTDIVNALDFRCLAVSNNKDALSYLDTPREKISLLITDAFRRPHRAGESGYVGLNLIQTVNERWPNLPVILASKDKSDDLKSRSPNLQISALIDKSQTYDYIAKTIIRVIEGDRLSTPWNPNLLAVTKPFSLDLIRIPASEFLMGSDLVKDSQAVEDEQPIHPLFLPEFYIARLPITNEQYGVFVQHTKGKWPEHWSNGEIPDKREKHPVTNVTWYDAIAFCEWLTKATGKRFRLPSEAEWEKAARGENNQLYPWGEEPPTSELCNFEGSNINDTTPVERYLKGASSYGILDMAGNSCEWTGSMWGKEWSKPEFNYPYNPLDGRESTRVDYDVMRVVRGGSFIDGAERLRCAFRNRVRSSHCGRYFGFRVSLEISQ